MKLLTKFLPVSPPAIPRECQVLWDAAAIIERHGHCKFELTSEAGERCTAMAIMEAARVVGYDATDGAFDMFVAHIGGNCHGDICSWNNAPERTQAEVVQALRAAALEG